MKHFFQLVAGLSWERSVESLFYSLLIDLFPFPLKPPLTPYDEPLPIFSIFPRPEIGQIFLFPLLVKFSVFPPSSFSPFPPLRRTDFPQARQSPLLSWPSPCSPYLRQIPPVARSMVSSALSNLLFPFLSPSGERVFNKRIVFFLIFVRVLFYPRRFCPFEPDRSLMSRGRTHTRESLLIFSPVFSCESVISGSVGSFPSSLFFFFLEQLSAEGLPTIHILYPPFSPPLPFHPLVKKLARLVISLPFFVVSYL